MKYSSFFISIFTTISANLSEYELLERLDASPLLTLPAATVRPELSDQSELPPEFQRKGFAGKGANGEVWRARSREGPHSEVVLKRIFIDRKYPVETGAREIYFGQKFGDTPFLSRFIKYFADDVSLWLVFADEGVSLYSLLFSVDAKSGMLQRSPLWKYLRDHPDASLEILRQVLKGLDTIHSQGIVHRDLKLENIFIRQTATREISVRVGDWGSAFSAEALFLYPEGISVRDETSRVSPPEPLGSNRNPSFDIFTLGISFLEIFLGRMDLLTLPDSPDCFARLCISVSCSLEEFGEVLTSLDPLNIGMTNRKLLSLVKEMISGQPESRPLADAILNSPLFTPRGVSLALSLPMGSQGASETCPLTRIEFATSQGARSAMEDRVVVQTESGNLLVCVLDGHKGTETVEIASEHLRKNFRRLKTAADLKNIFGEIAMETEKMISGSTATCVARLGNSTCLAHIGDTRALAVQEISEREWLPVVGGATEKGNVVLEISGDAVKVELDSGRVSYERFPRPPENLRLVRTTQLTRDHKATDETETSRIQEAGGDVVDGRVNGLAISRSLGAWLAKPHVTAEAEIKKLDIPWSMIVICSDGVFDVLENQRVAEMAAISAQRIIVEATRRGARDNLACVVIEE